jgi:hypothetical protein
MPLDIAHLDAPRVARFPANLVREPAGTPIDLGWSLRLLRNTSLRISLFRLAFDGVDADTVEEIAAEHLAADGMVQRLSDGAVGLLMVRFDADDAGTTRRILAKLRRALAHRGLSPPASVEVTGLHRSAAVVGDIEELFDELSCEEACVVHQAAAA